MQLAEGEFYSVSDINALVCELVEENFPQVSVIGEVSNFRRHSSGHLYFTLKDEDAQLRGVCFRGTARKINVDIADGMRIVVAGRLTVYAGYGQYQIVADDVMEAGEGRLELAFQRLKARLEDEGLFDPGNKRPLPPYPETIAVITSPTGAAIRDIVTTIERRWPCVDLLIVPVRVQGELATAEITAALEMVSRADGIDLVIAGRGGGSLEDLWSFNEEPVARAIFECPVPVISAVGHETDVTIADLVADVRAATPTMAGEIAVPVRDEVRASIEGIRLGLIRDMMTRLELHKRGLNEMLRSHALGKIRGRIENALQKLDHLVESLERAAIGAMAGPRKRLDEAAVQLAALDPRAVLSRGFALCTDPVSGNVVGSRKGALEAGAMNVSFHDGTVGAEVKGEST